MGYGDWLWGVLQVGCRCVLARFWDLVQTDDSQLQIPDRADSAFARPGGMSCGQ